MAFAMGRTLVLPPQKKFYLLGKNDKGQRNDFGFDHFFHMESISSEHVGFDIITMTEFLELCVQGKIVDETGNTLTPPNKRTNWDGAGQQELSELNNWLREKSHMLTWDPNDCIAAFPATTSEDDLKALEALPQQIEESGGFPSYEIYIGKPTPVNAPPIDRLKEMNAERKELCTYTPELQNTPWVHFPVGHIQEGKGSGEEEESRLLVHFYAFLFFQDWSHDLWMKRFVRDHVRYIDELQCAAARIVVTLRNRVSQRTNGKSKDFDTVHIRRGDFQYKVTRFEAPKIVEMLSRKLSNNTTLYIATDERDKSFFKPIQERYDVVFLDDFKHELEGVNSKLRLYLDVGH
jgi:hypothetical protein